MTDSPKSDFVDLSTTFGFGIRSFAMAVRVAQVLAVATVALGGWSLLGWALHLPALESVFPGLAVMKVNTALCFALSGSALLVGYLSAPSSQKKTYSLVLAALSTAISSLTLLEYLFNTSFGLDQAIFNDNSIPETPFPGRMTFNTALAFILFGAAIIALSRGIRGAMVAQGLSLGGLFVGLLALVGYMFNAQVFISHSLRTHLALHTIVGIGGLGIAILCARPKKGLMAAVLADSPGGLVARRLIGPAIFTPLFFGWIAFQGLRLNYYDAGFAASLVVLSSMIVICFLTTNSILELNRLDVERRRLAEARLNADVREVGALEASRLKSEFVANVSHELRTPMNGVLGMTSLLLDSPLNNEQREHVETIRQSGDALLNLVNEILDFSKIEAGKIVLDEKPFSLAHCVDEVINLLAVNARRNKINLISFIRPHVPGAFLGDTSRIRQILLNLLGNAIKFTEKGEVTLEVTSSPVRENLYKLEFLITDTGMGISPESLAQLFQPFQQGDASATRKHGGTGLGLTISKRLVELMHGEITVSSVVSQGSTFRFHVLLYSCALEGLVPEDRLPPSCRVIIVSQGGNYPVLLKSQLEAWGAKVLGIVDPMTLMQMLDTKVTAVLMDRDDDSVALAAQMQIDPDWLAVPRILLDYGEPLPEERLNLFAKHLTKPVKRSHLLVNLIELTGGKPSQPRISGPLGLPPLSDAVPLRILLAEDNHINQKVGLALLSRLGYRADVAANGMEALESVVRQHYDVVLLDIQMPEMGGIEAAAAMRKKLADKCPMLVALTANAFAGAREEYLSQGFDDYLSKPVLQPALRDLINRIGTKLHVPSTN